MRYNKKLIKELLQQLEKSIAEAKDNEEHYGSFLRDLHPGYRKSAENLLHYLALRKKDIRGLQEKLGSIGLSRLARAEMHVMATLVSIRDILAMLAGIKPKVGITRVMSVQASEDIISRNNMALLGRKPRGRRVRIMVTLPEEAATDYRMVYRIVSSGMNIARINCAQGTPEIWKAMIDNVRRASSSLGRSCRVAMDLGGPKLRTGSITPGPQVIYFKPGRDSVGQITKPARIWLTPPGESSPQKADAVIPVPAEWLSHAKKGDTVRFTDARGKERSMLVTKRKGKGRWCTCNDSAYITPGLQLVLIKKGGHEPLTATVGELNTLEEAIILKHGDVIVVHKHDAPGEQAAMDEKGNVVRNAHISCTLPEIFRDVKAGEKVLFDDGKIGGRIIHSCENEFHVRIDFAKEKGSRLRANKGINFPESNLTVKGLTDKDRQDLSFVIRHADIVNISFVNRHEDIGELVGILRREKAKVGIIVKIETRQGYRNLPEILLSAMQWYPVGVMVARGDLAIECGWKELAKIQEEILRFCSAAHVPDIWATQVLENLARKGFPSRAEITDAAMSQRAECVMLNKGPHIERAIAMLNDILTEMQHYQVKNITFLPSLFDPDGKGLNPNLLDQTKEKQ